MEPSPSYQFGYFAGMIGGALLVLGVIAFGVFSFIMALMRRTKGWIICTIVFALLGFGAFIVGIVAGVKGLQKAQASAAQPKTKVSSDGWISLRVPGNWKDLPNINNAGTIKAGNLIREEYCIALSDEKTDLIGNLDDFHELVLDSIRERLTGCVTGPPQSLVINGFPARRVRVSGRSGAISVLYHHTAIETPEGFHQLVMWTLPSKEKFAWPVFDRTAASFAVVGPRPALPAREERKPRPGSMAERLQAVMGEVLGKAPSQIPLGSSLARDLGADELDLVEIVMAVEEEFDVEITDETAESLKTPADFIKHLETKAAAAVERP